MALMGHSLGDDPQADYTHVELPPKREAIRRIGGDPTRLEDAQLKKGAFHAYVEMHIEQGATLERLGIPVGVVDGIVAVDHYDVKITGFANHAGTTPMADRQDALIAAARLTLAVREVVTSSPGRQVGTVGHLEVFPNATNVIPGEVRLTEVRPGEVRPDELRPAELRQAEVRLAEIRLAEICFAKICLN